MVPTGSVFWMGLGSHHPFYKNFLERFGVFADFERAGSYKSFAEPYTRETASEQYKEQYSSLLASIQSQLIDGVSKGRGIEAKVLEELLGSSPLSAKRALEMKLIDELAYEDQYLDELEKFSKSKSFRRIIE